VKEDLQTHAYTDKERIGREKRLELLHEALDKVLIMLSTPRYKKENAMEIIIENYSDLP
jgi:predicted metal-dependent TIM-barrel fold hydrolase